MSKDIQIIGKKPHKYKEKRSIIYLQVKVNSGKESQMYSIFVLENVSLTASQTVKNIFDLEGNICL